MYILDMMTPELEAIPPVTSCRIVKFCAVTYDRKNMHFIHYISLTVHEERPVLACLATLVAYEGMHGGHASP
jgi:hypothetical protein